MRYVKYVFFQKQIRDIEICLGNEETYVMCQNVSK